MVCSFGLVSPAGPDFSAVPLPEHRDATPKSLGFLPTMPQLNYKISALEQVLDAPELQQTPDSFHGKDDTIVYDHVSFGYTKTQPGPDGKPMVVEDEYSTTSALRPRQDRKRPWWESPAQARALWQNC